VYDVTVVRINPSGVNTNPEPPPWRSRGSPERLSGLCDADLHYRKDDLLEALITAFELRIESAESLGASGTGTCTAGSRIVERGVRN